MAESDESAGMTAMSVLQESEWRSRAASHRERLAPIVNRHLERQNRGEKHPIYDFLFQYYSFPASKLMQWHPGLGVTLSGDASIFLSDGRYGRNADGVTLDPRKFPFHRLTAARWTVSLLEKTAARVPRFGCFGLHEWAMVYRQPEVRHGQLPLRMRPDELAVFIESQSVCCSHFDAFRFFTPAARPLNSLQLTRPLIPEMEQGGCLHANMDLFKWAYKFFPWTDGELTADCFLLAVAARELDMRASPYDCRSLGFEPVRIETEEGRGEYAVLQRAISGRAVSLRARLCEEYRKILAATGPDEMGANVQ
jgi:hypothetical protein